ncbi:MAG: DUF1616 domain-containing protein [Candidatus Bathyarchaeota archaeon]|nr:DUF1616 domain-containing protein [Candidatus Bathyarchaeota archaeon]
MEEHRVVFVVVTGVLVLLVASPALSRLLVLPRTEFFTELWLLDSNNRAEDYPFNVTVSEEYNVFLGIGNRLGYAAYYKVAVKFRNQTQLAPTSFGPVGNRTPSSLPALFNITAFVEDEGVWELPLTFSFDYGYNETLSRIAFYGLMLNDVTLDMRGYAIAWNSTNNEFRGFLFFELWIYDRAIGNFQYHERFVSLRLNMTGS